MEILQKIRSLRDKLIELKQLKEQTDFYYDPFAIANTFLRESQQIPQTSWSIWLLNTGRGFGKTFTGSSTILQMALSGKYKNIGIISKTIDDVKNVMVEGESGIIKVAQKYTKFIKNSPNKMQKFNDNFININPIPLYKKSTNKLIWNNGSVVTFYSADNLEKLRGPQFDLVWIDEIAKFSNSQELFDQVLLCLRLGTDPKMIITTTPTPSEFIKNLISSQKEKNIYITNGSTFENQENLSTQYLQSIITSFNGTKFGDQEIYGKIIEKDYILWNEHHIKKAQLSPKLLAIIYDENADKNHNNDCDKIVTSLEIEKIIISIDPAVTERGDETGIIVCGKSKNDFFYILEDLSGHYSPNDWCKIVINAYQKWAAFAECKVVAEVNNGGDLVEKLLQNIARSQSIFMPYKSVRASKNKLSRMQPIFILYQENKVIHIQKFHRLEHQMTHMEQYHSPDRIDAMVWGITCLIDQENAKIRISVL